jgi:hypothetical protein
MQAHRTMCPVKGKQIEIDLPEALARQTQVEVMVLPVSATELPPAEVDTGAWLQRVWGSVPDFPDRPQDLPPEPVAAL